MCFSVFEDARPIDTVAKKTKREELIDGYAYYRANTENSTEEFQVLARQVADTMTNEELEAYLKDHEDEN